MVRKFGFLIGLVGLFSIPTLAASVQRVGEVSTTFRVLGANDKIVIDAFADPRAPGVTCHLSHLETGGLNPWAENGSDASIACRQTGPITVSASDLKRFEGEDVFSVSQSVFFKSMHVRRIVDVPNNTIVYLTFSDKLIDGSKKHAITSVPIMPWR
jgi:CreA protein